MFDLKTLHWFVIVSELGNFSATAARFKVTPSAVSMAISRLERQLSTRLFQRTTRQLHLTPEGEIFLEKARECIALLNGAAEQLKDLSQEPNGRIRLSASPSLRRPHLLPMLADFLARYPKVSIENSFDPQAPDLIRDGIDIAIVRGGTTTSDSNYVTRTLCKLPVVLVASPTYLARNGVPKTIGDLHEHDWILSPTPDVATNSLKLVKGTAGISGGGAESAGRLNINRLGTSDAGHPSRHIQLPPPHRIRYAAQPGGEEVSEMVMLGLGIGLASLNRVMDDLRRGRLKLVLPDYVSIGPGNLLLQYPHRRYLSPKIRALADFLAMRFAGEPDFNIDPASLHAYAA